MRKELYEYAISYHSRWADDKLFQTKGASTNFVLGIMIFSVAVFLMPVYLLRWQYGIILTVLYALFLLKMFKEKDVYAKKLFFTFIWLLFISIPPLIMVTLFLNFRWWIFLVIILLSILSYETIFFGRIEAKKYSIRNAFPKKHRKLPYIAVLASYSLGKTLRWLFEDEPWYFYMGIPILAFALAYSIAFGQRYLVYKILSISDEEISENGEKKPTSKG